MTKFDIEMRALNFNQKIMIHRSSIQFQVCIIFIESIKWYEFKKKKLRKLFIATLEYNKPLGIFIEYFSKGWK